MPAPIAGRQKGRAAGLRGPRQGKVGMYRRKVAPGAQALQEAAHARYLADLRAHYEEVRAMHCFLDSSDAGMHWGMRQDRSTSAKQHGRRWFLTNISLAGSVIVASIPVQVDAFELAVETPSPQLQQRSQHAGAGGTPLSIGLAALSIADEPPSTSDGRNAEDKVSPKAEHDSAAAVDVEQSSVEEVAADEAGPDFSSAPAFEQFSGSIREHAVPPDPSDPRSETAAAAAQQDGGRSAATADSADIRGMALPDCPTHEGQDVFKVLPATLKGPAAPLSGAMALGMSRRRSSMMMPAPPPAVSR